MTIHQISARFSYDVVHYTSARQTILIYTVQLHPTVHDTQIEFHVNFKKWVTVLIIRSWKNYANLIADVFHCGKYLTKHFDVCSLFRFVTLQSYMQSVTIRARDVCITLK